MVSAETAGQGLQIANISKRFADIQAVSNISLNVPRGSLVGFLGPNGSGKTTTMRAVVGMVKLDAGSITWDRMPIDESVRTRIGYMPQERGLYARMGVKDQVIYFGRLAGMSKSDASARAEYWLERLGVSERSDALVQDLSGGNQQRVQLAVSLVHDPDLLILDEPFAGLDPVAVETMGSIIAERSAAGASVLFSSHQLDLVEDLSKEVVIVADGEMLASGSIQDLRSASPKRRLQVRWVNRVHSWTPLDGSLVSFDNDRAVVDLSADDDLGANIAHVLAAGPVSEISVEPPSLDELFVELVEEKA
jgi:ABC-2 type transport system ATP-binding protein